MKNYEIKLKNKSLNYSIIIGNNAIDSLPQKIKLLCPKTKKIAIIIDKKIPKKFKKTLKNKLKSYNLFFFDFFANEKTKSLKTVSFFLNNLLTKNFNRSDLIISVGGGITGDVVGFISSIYKRGINFINMPTTLLAQVDSAIGGKTGINSSQGKNLIGSFYQPKLVISDTLFLKSLPKKEMICGFAEILKHSIIKDKAFFNWLQKNSKNIFMKKQSDLVYAIKKSCLIKIFFVSRDVGEEGLRMKLNFGHTFAHAIEGKNNFNKRITHGEAVLTGMILEARLSVIKRLCKKETLKKIEQIYSRNNLSYTFKKIYKNGYINKLIPYLKNDKKNFDEDINFILLKKIGKTSIPNKNKISLKELSKISPLITQ